jgi:hypothetical protein
MSAEPQFLSFKGLKQYTPEQGWGQVNDMLNAHRQTAPPPITSANESVAVPDNVPTLTDVPEPNENLSSPLFDPLMNELFEQLRVAPTDELTQTWRTIAAEVNLLTQRMALQRELQERMRKLDQDLVDLRGTIMQRLNDVQHAADQQLAAARQRVQVSALAQSKLASKLKP